MHFLVNYRHSLTYPELYFSVPPFYVLLSLAVAMWRIIKTWLPPKSVEKIKFVDKKSLSQYVKSDQALTAWGGQDSYEFVFEPEKRRPLPWASGAAALDSDARKVRSHTLASRVDY